MRSLRASERTRKFLCAAALALVFLCVPGAVWALFTIIFQGAIAVVSTGSTTLSAPAGVAVDSVGNAYIADTANNQIVEVSANGTTSVVAMTGLSPALSAPAGLALDGSGNLYISDSGNNRIVKLSAGAASVAPMGSITLSAPQGLAFDSAGNLYIADSGNNRIVNVLSNGTAA